MFERFRGQFFKTVKWSVATQLLNLVSLWIIWKFIDTDTIGLYSIAISFVAVSTSLFAFGFELDLFRTERGKKKASEAIVFNILLSSIICVIWLFFSFSSILYLLLYSSTLSLIIWLNLEVKIVIDFNRFKNNHELANRLYASRYLLPSILKLSIISFCKSLFGLLLTDLLAISIILLWHGEYFFKFRYFKDNFNFKVMLAFFQECKYVIIEKLSKSIESTLILFSVNVIYSLDVVSKYSLIDRFTSIVPSHFGYSVFETQKYYFKENYINKNFRILKKILIKTSLLVLSSGLFSLLILWMIIYSKPNVFNLFKPGLSISYEFLIFIGLKNVFKYAVSSVSFTVDVINVLSLRFLGIYYIVALILLVLLLFITKLNDFYFDFFAVITILYRIFEWYYTLRIINKKVCVDS